MPNKAKPREALTANDLGALKVYHGARLTSRVNDLARITGEIEQRQQQGGGE